MIGVLRDYDTTDKQSLGNASHMYWHNPLYVEETGTKRNKHALDTKDTVRVATVQFQMRQIADVQAFEDQVEYFVDVGVAHPPFDPSDRTHRRGIARQAFQTGANLAEAVQHGTRKQRVAQQVTGRDRCGMPRECRARSRPRCGSARALHRPSRRRAC